ncbi:MAG: FAD-dependent oxidoreductase [Selenomonadaceae bacterium]|nr:FAD-dependent oxidoreductase [Selenomonadaceae bacterium]
MIKTDVAIIGAGFAGIAAGLAAKEKNLRATLFEATEDWGGLCGNFSVDGFRFDKAVHFAFNEPPLVERLFLSQPHYAHSSESRNYADGSWVRHPVQNNLRELPFEERIKVIQSFIDRPDLVDDEGYENYQQWLEVQFGKYFADKYPARYTRKYWGTDAANLNCNWCGGRLYQPSLEEVLRGAFPDSPKPANVYYTKSMHYPKTGGYKNFVAELAAQSDIRYGHKVTAIDTAEKILTFANGETCHYEKLISTIPLPLLVKLITRDKEILAAADELQTTSMALISVGYNKAFDFPTNWFYVYDEEIPFARVHSPSGKSPDNVPQGCSSLQFEIYYSRELPLKFTDGELVEKTLDAMEKMGVARRADIAALDCRHVEFANVIFYEGMEQTREIIRREVARNEIISCGRFGEWDYLWSVQSFMSGYNALQEGLR